MSPRTTVFVLLLCLPAVFSNLFGRRSVEVDEEDYVALPPGPKGDALEPRIGHRSVVKERFNGQGPPSGR